jgi:hypothetical protein
MRQSWIVVVAVICGGGCAFDELAGPAVNMVQVVPGGSGRGSRMRGDMELYLTRDEPSHTFWNDWETEEDAWGTITLKEVERDGAVVVDFGGSELRARPGRVFPGTGIKVIASHPRMGTASVRTRWTLTIMEDVR